MSYATLLDAYFGYDGAVRFPRSGSQAAQRPSTVPLVARRRASPKRQYAPVIFAHDATQREAATKALARIEGGIATVVEDVYQASGTAFWDAEPYHQKWKLQRRRELMLALALPNELALFGPAATTLNAFAGGALDPATTRQRLRRLVEERQLDAESYEAVQKLLESQQASAPGAWRR